MISSTVSSTPVLRATLIWGLAIGSIVILGAAALGFAVAQSQGLWSGVVGALVGVVFPSLTAVSILIANRWYGSTYFLQIFFGVVLGGWLLKFVLVIVALFVLGRMPWVVPIVFYLSLVTAAVASLVVDLVVLSRMRLPAVSDATLPGPGE